MRQLVFILITTVHPFLLASCQPDLAPEIVPDYPPAEQTIDLPDDPHSSQPGFSGVPENIVESFDYEEIMSVRSIASAQGGDCWGDYFFQFTTNNGSIRVFDLALKTQVQTIYIPASQQGFVSNCHSNTACFGTEYYAPEDLFPLIYVSTGYAADGYTGALVYRITQNAQGRFSVSLVQTLRFPKMYSSWTEFIPAGDYAFLCYPGDLVIYQVKMPKLSDGDVIIDPKSAALKTHRFPPQPDWLSSSRNQDRLFDKGRIMFLTGVPQSGEFSGLIILNLEKGTRESILDFTKNGLTSEPESLFVWQGDLCVTFKDRIVKLFL